jgi:hypothetical protein
VYWHATRGARLQAALPATPRRSTRMARLALFAALLALLTWRGDATCGAATVAVAASVAAAGACADGGANTAVSCSAACTSGLDAWVAGCKGAPLPNASSFTLLALAQTSLNGTLNACRAAFLDRAHTFSTQAGTTDGARPPWRPPALARGADAQKQPAASSRCIRAALYATMARAHASTRRPAPRPARRR